MCGFCCRSFAVARRPIYGGLSGFTAGPPSLAYGEGESTVADPLPARGTLVIRNAYLLTMDPSLDDVRRGDIRIRDGMIQSVEPTSVGDSEEVDAEIIDGTGMIAMPGIVDTHWHMWNSLLRGWVGPTAETAYFPTLRRFAPHYTPADTYNGVRLALTEALNAGVTTVHNWAHNIRSPQHADASVQAHADSGLRARFSYGSAQGTDPDTMQDFVDLARLKGERFSDRGDGLLTLGAALRGPQMSSVETSRREFEAAKKLGLPITVHVTGDAMATEKFKVIQTLYADRFLGPDVQIIHAVHATPTDIAVLAGTGTHVSVSPYAEFASMGVPPVNAFLSAGILTSLSIDNTALPSSVDPFALMRGLVVALKARDGASSNFGPREALKMATIDGACDLGVDRQTGSLTPGKRADVILIRTTDLNMTMASDAHVDRMLMAAQPANVDTVVVDGRVLKRCGKIVAYDVGSVVARALDSSADLRRKAA